MLKQWYDLKVPALPFGSIIAAAEQPGFCKATEGKGEFSLANVVNAGNAASKATPWTMKFYDAYTKRWKVEPEGYGASSSYMAVYTLKDAIERAGSLDSEAVIKALEKTDLMGVYGRIRFDPKSTRSSPVWIPRKARWAPSSSGRRASGWWSSRPPSPPGDIMLPPWMKK